MGISASISSSEESRRGGAPLGFAVSSAGGVVGAAEASSGTDHTPVPGVVGTGGGVGFGVDFATVITDAAFTGGGAAAWINDGAAFTGGGAAAWINGGAFQRPPTKRGGTLGAGAAGGSE